MKIQKPSAVVDIIIEQDNQVLLIKRKHKPFQNMWAFPGGFLDCGKETLEQACVRELQEETSLKSKIEDLQLFGVYSSPDRDPRGHVISHVYVAKNFTGEPKADDDAKDTRFFKLENLPKLAFDHNEILNDYKNCKNV